jgi:hypothetical protein
VQNVEHVGLTEGYENKFLLFHKLFLKGVEKFEGASGHRRIGSSGDRKARLKFKIEILKTDPLLHYR